MVGTRRHRRRLARLMAAMTLLVAVVIVALKAGTALLVHVPLANPDAIITLSSHEWERLPAAAQLAKTYPDALVFLTAPKVATIYNCHDCEHRADRLVAAGVARERVVVLPKRVSNTRDEAAAARDECVQRNIRRLVIVTSPYHTRRAWRMFDAAFDGTGVALGIVPASPAAARPDRWWHQPYDRSYVRYEWAAIVYYALRP